MRKKRRIKKELEWYSFIIVPLVTVLILVYYPMMTTIEYSFFDVSAYGYTEKFVGIRNYERLLVHSAFPRAFGNTLILAAMGLCTIPIGFLMANMINGIGRGKLQGFFRVGFYLPHIITGVSVVMALKIVLKTDNGLFNNFLSWIFQRDISIGWLSDARYSRIGVTIMYLWSNLGYSILMNLASLQAIPQELYEAACVDGAGTFKQCIYITIPNMKGCFTFLFVTGMISGLARFTDLYVLGGNNTSGAPAGTLQTIMMYIYEYSFEKLEYGVSSAGAMLLFVITFIFTMINVRLSNFFKDG